MSDNPTSADNQQVTLNHFGFRGSSETTRQAPLPHILKAYLLGAIHDGTYSVPHRTFRISQKGTAWLKRLRTMLTTIGHKSWLYKEGKERDVYVLETTASFLTLDYDPLTLKSARERIAYVRGYFDAEGGMPHSKNAPLYIQICQKNRRELQSVRFILETVGIRCGKIHNPSKAVDPHYWRFYIARRSHIDFIRKISTWHPRKEKLLRERMMI